MSDLIPIATKIRQQVIKMLFRAGSGHSAGSLDMADIFSVIYFSDLFQLNPASPSDPSRDRVILSNGHICPGLYAALALKGYFPLEELNTLRQFGSRLQGHPHKNFSTDTSPLGTKDQELGTNLPGIENTAGPLGQGIGFAVGLALGLRCQFESKRLTRFPRVICLCGDGELNEGQCWEAFMSAAKFKLKNLVFIIDRNDIQIDGYTEEVMPLEPLKDRLSSFGLITTEINGHNHTAIYNALRIKHYESDKPLAIIAHTIPGKGVSFMEGKYSWHGKTPNKDEAAIALRELLNLQNNITQD